MTLQDRALHWLPRVTHPLTFLGALMLVLALFSGDLFSDTAHSEGDPKGPKGDAQVGQQAPAKGDAAGRPTEARMPAPWPDRARSAAQVKTAEDIEGVEDPLVLREAGRHHLTQGNPELAKACFVAAIAREEINLYSAITGKPYADALVLELMGDLEGSRAKWRTLFQSDVLTAYMVLRHFSIDPEREALLKAAGDHVKEVIAAAKEGKEAPIYVTKKGDPRALKVMSNDDVLEAFEQGKPVRYAYIEELDLSNKTFDKAITCMRCVVGSLKGWNSQFEEQLTFVGFVLGDVHLGKRWKGKVNKSAIEPASTFNRLYLNKSVILGNLNLDSIKLNGRVLNMPMVVVEGEVNMRNAAIQGSAELRYAYIGGQFDAKGAEFHGSNYFGHTHFGAASFTRVVVTKNPLYFNSAEFSGPANFEKCEIKRGATFEAAVFHDKLTMRQSRIDARLNFSRTVFMDELIFSQVELTDLDFLGSDIKKLANFSDSIFKGNVRFALDGLTRRMHLDDVTPLHKLYKQYQGDDDADRDLTMKSQYGVTHVDDLTAMLRGNVSFANTIFQKFVNFEGVQFGSDRGAGQLASFFNTQFYGEAHFERTRFLARADFRTIFGNEVSFNDARFYDTWMLDDANVPGRLSASGVKLEGDATLSFYGARIASFGVSFAQLLDDARRHRLFHEQCFHEKDKLNVRVQDPRLVDARWDAVAEKDITDPEEVQRRAREMCLTRAIGEFVLLKDSFTKRGMGEENDWAYWHLRHYKNVRELTYGGALGMVMGSAKWLIFEKGFGWGVRLSNLLGTGMVVVFIYVVLLRLFCADMLVSWDNNTIKFRDLPVVAMFIVSFHSFLGRARDWKSVSSPGAFKVLYTTEMIIGIILITFFIGAYTRMVLR